MQHLQGKTALITGASKGIGEATARYFASHGATVVICARNGEALEQIARQINEQGGKATAIALDVASAESVQNACDLAVSQYGGIDILVNNAGVIDPVARIDESDPAHWSRVVDINFKGVYFALRSVLPYMLKQGGGTVINISSGAATNALEGWSHYCSTKAAVLSLTRCTDKEYRQNGIRALGLSPGTVATDMQLIIKDSGVNPVSQLDPSAHIPVSDVAQAIAWLCSDQADEYLGADFSLRGAEARQKVGLAETW